MALYDRNEQKEFNVLNNGILTTYLFEFDLKKFNILKKELIDKMGVTRQINRKDVIIDNINILEIIYKDAIHYNKYGSVEIINHYPYNENTVKDIKSPLYKKHVVSYVATIRDIPAICVAIELVLNKKNISLEHIKEYYEQFLSLKQVEEIEGINVIPFNLKTNNNYNITSKERNLSLDELEKIFASFSNCFEILKKYEQALADADQETINTAINNAKILELIQYNKNTKEKSRC